MMAEQTAQVDDSKNALALQWATASLMPEYIEPSEFLRSADAQQLGRTLASDVLLPFCAELVLKALAVRGESGSDRERTHNLTTLYRALPAETQAAVRTRHQRMARELGWQVVDIPAFFAMHAEDSRRWRYLDDELYMLCSEPQEFQLVICALLEEVLD